MLYIRISFKASYLGKGDLHDTRFDNTKKMIQLSRFGSGMAQNIAGHCIYTLHLYSSTKFEDESASQFETAFRIGTIFGIVLAVVFGTMAMTIVVFGHCVRRRNAKEATHAALQYDETLSSLFSLSHSSSISEPLKVTLTLSKATELGDEDELKFELVSKGSLVHHHNCDTGEIRECDEQSGIFA